MNIVIVGSSRGIGHQLAKALVSQGHTVYGIARSRQIGYPGFIPITANILVPCEFNDIPAVDALIFCAGSQPPIGPAMAIDPHEWFFGVRDNLLSCFNAMHTFFQRLMMAQRRGKVIVFSGGGATKARPNLSAYACAKTAIIRLVETLSEEWRGIRIDINAIAPGAIATVMTQEIISFGELAGAREVIDAKKTIEQDNEAAMDTVIKCVSWLLSEASDGISGRLIAAKWDNWQGMTPGNLGDEAWKLRRLI